MTLPLQDKKIAVTRAASQAGKLADLLEDQGADVFMFPTIQIVPTEDLVDFNSISLYDWIIFTSTNVVDYFFRQLDSSEIDSAVLSEARICAVGPSTADAIAKHGLDVNLVPDKHDGEHLLEALKNVEYDLSGMHFLFPHGDLARRLIPDELRKLGAEVTETIVYRTISPTVSEGECDILLAFEPDIITFTSPSTAENFCNIIGKQRLETLCGKAVFASIGPVTTRAAQELGLPNIIEDEKSTIEGLVNSIVNHVAGT